MKKIKNAISLLLVLFVMGTVSVSANYDSGWRDVYWTVVTKPYDCSNASYVNEEVWFAYQFIDKGTYDAVQVDATNYNCRDSDSAVSVRAMARNEGSSAVYGNWAAKGQDTALTIGAKSGTDQAGIQESQ